METFLFKTSEICAFCELQTILFSAMIFVQTIQNEGRNFLWIGLQSYGWC